MKPRKPSARFNSSALPWKLPTDYGPRIKMFSFTWDEFCIPVQVYRNAKPAWSSSNCTCQYILNYIRSVSYQLCCWLSRFLKLKKQSTFKEKQYVPALLRAPPNSFWGKKDAQISSVSGHIAPCCVLWFLLWAPESCSDIRPRGGNHTAQWEEPSFETPMCDTYKSEAI